MKQNLKQNPKHMQNLSKFWENPKPKIWPVFKYIDSQKLKGGLSIKIQSAKKFVVAKFLRHQISTLNKMKLKTVSNHENNDKRAPQ